MSVSVKLAGFALGLVAVFGASFGLGRAVGPVGGEPAPPPAATTTSTTTAPGHGGHS
ncbi:MAG: hypothetical protein JWO77_2803 [Ilumatobacteraceae bacterium]|nr:hypothetical protein [Ilumatobacteraceae bacterium]